MPNSQAPASFVIDTNNPIRHRYSVISQNKFEAVVENDACWGLFLGQLLLFDNNVKGIVTAVDSSRATVRLKGADPVNYGLSYDWLSFNAKPTQVLLAPAADIGALFVVCDNADTTRPGFVGWTLFKDGTPIAIGNDRQRKDTCVIEGTGSWKPGVYTLEARSFLEQGLQSLHFAKMSWQITLETERLSAGTSADTRPTLALV